MAASAASSFEVVLFGEPSDARFTDAGVEEEATPWEGNVEHRGVVTLPPEAAAVDGPLRAYLARGGRVEVVRGCARLLDVRDEEEARSIVEDEEAWGPMTYGAHVYMVCGGAFGKVPTVNTAGLRVLSAFVEGAAGRATRTRAPKDWFFARWEARSRRAGDCLAPSLTNALRWRLQTRGLLAWYGEPSESTFSLLVEDRDGKVVPRFHPGLMELYRKRMARFVEQGLFRRTGSDAWRFVGEAAGFFVFGAASHVAQVEAPVTAFLKLAWRISKDEPAPAAPGSRIELPGDEDGKEGGDDDAEGDHDDAEVPRETSQGVPEVRLEASSSLSDLAPLEPGTRGLRLNQCSFAGVEADAVRAWFGLVGEEDAPPSMLEVLSLASCRGVPLWLLQQLATAQDRFPNLRWIAPVLCSPEGSSERRGFGDAARKAAPDAVASGKLLVGADPLVSHNRSVAVSFFSGHA